MNLGNFMEASVLRETDISFVLQSEGVELFLHKKEATEPLKSGDRIRVFVYPDHLGRPTASMLLPLATTDRPAFLEVVAVNPQLGVFLYNGMPKDVLLSKDFLPVALSQWPQPGDRLFVVLKEKKGMLFARQISRKSISAYFDDPVKIEDEETVDAYVSFFLLEGLVAFTEHGHEIFIHSNNTRKPYRLGEMVSVRLLKQNESGEYVGSLIGRKEAMLDADAQAILDYLNHHDGSMRFTDKSSPEDIHAAFKMSKSAFKRALGTLYKAEAIVLTEHTTQIKQT
jgi:hypothetical protein